jgi:hypothetical protein
MSSIVLAGDSSGQITVTAPLNAGTNTLTLPAETGTLLSSGASVIAVTGNVSGGNLSTAGQVSATGNIVTANYVQSLFSQSNRNITSSVTIGNINVMSAGPITINDGVIVTISTGGEWAIV